MPWCAGSRRIRAARPPRTSGELPMAASPSHRVSTGERLNTAETTGKIQQAVSARGIRMTRQRRVILQVMDDAEQHLDVDQILERRSEEHTSELQSQSNLVCRL